MAVDVEIFDRLRSRAQRRHSAGIDATPDLVAALRLVRSQPFTGVRSSGWSWFFDREHTDQILRSAIVDVATAVVTRSLEIQDLRQAYWAARVASWAAPDDESVRDDLMMTACLDRGRRQAEMAQSYVSMRTVRRDPRRV